ncbi:MAG: CHASE2 domain-containing protein [Cyanobacteria bacterium P01_F01_bin.86]
MKRKTSNLLSNLGGGSSFSFLSGLGLIMLVSLVRVAGFLESMELQSLDLLLRLSPIEAPDERITIIGITDEDLQNLGTYPVPDSEFIDILESLEAYKPRVVGIDVFRDLPVGSPLQDADEVESSYDELTSLFKASPNIVAIDKIFGYQLSKPEGIPEDRAGFADALLDDDGFIRRSLLAHPNPTDPDDFRLSFTVRLAEQYLAMEGVSLENGIQDENAMRFGPVELFRVRSNSGGYINQDTGENPVVLLNFRNNPEPFNTLSLSQFRQGDFPEEWLKDRVVLIGMRADSAKDFVNSAGVISANPGKVTGVALQAHAVSQIIGAVLDGRPMLKTWMPHWEYLWIIVNGLLGMMLARGIRLARLENSKFLGIPIFIGIGVVSSLASYGLFLFGVWTPLVPALLAYSLTGSSGIFYRIYQREQHLISERVQIKVRLNERKRVIEQSYHTIHNGPLQTLKGLIRQTSSAQPNLSPEFLVHELKTMDAQLRNIYEFMEREYLTLDTQTYLTPNYAINLNNPLHELLHQVYQNKLEESSYYFDRIKIKIPDFSPMGDQPLSLANKEDIIRFLEEALCNIEQHAKDVTRLIVTCKQESSQNIIRIIDNGKGLPATTGLKRIGDGTKQANVLARRLAGRFSRQAHMPQGTLCELAWPVNSSLPWSRWFRF